MLAIAHISSGLLCRCAAANPLGPMWSTRVLGIMPVASYRLDPETNVWRVDDKRWVCPAVPKFEGDTWEAVHD